jgi:hypothetical protein
VVVVVVVVGGSVVVVVVVGGGDTMVVIVVAAGAAGGVASWATPVAQPARRSASPIGRSANLDIDERWYPGGGF